MAWRIEFAEGAHKELPDIDPAIARRILAFLRQRLAVLDDPRSIGEALRGPRLGGFWKYRVGDWRIVVAIEDDVSRILVLRIGHLREVYR